MCAGGSTAGPSGVAYFYDEYHNREGNLIALVCFALVGALMLAVHEPFLALAPFAIAGSGFWKLWRARRITIICDEAGFVVASRSGAAGEQVRGTAGRRSRPRSMPTADLRSRRLLARPSPRRAARDKRIWSCA